MKLYYYQSNQYKGVFMNHIMYEQFKQSLLQSILAVPGVIV